MSYTTRIKNEISKLTSSKPEMIAELSAYVRNNGYVSQDKFYLATENKSIVKRITKFFEDIYDIKPALDSKENLNFSKNKLTLIVIKENMNLILQDLGYYDKNNKYLKVVPNYIVGSNEEIRAYLRGVFLCQGSINDPKTSQYHMELFIDKKEEAVFVQKLLNIFYLNAKIFKRNNGYMIYIKEAEKISDFLKIINATTSVLYFENVRIYHEEKNKANRLNNCEQANTDKIIQTASEQLKYIEIIEKNMENNLLDDKTLEALNYRKKYPESSLKELSEIISLETNNKITKSGLNHRFRKIKDLAMKFEQNENKATN